MRQLFTYWPPRIVSAKCTFQLSRSSLLRHRRGHAAFGHHGVRLAEQRLADEADRDAGVGRLDRGAQAGAAGADDEHVVGMRVRAPPSEQSSGRSSTPIEQRRT